MDYIDLKKKLELRKDFNDAKEKNRLAFEIAEMIMNARERKGITQKELAELLNTRQPSIARIERGETLPSLSFLERIAKALDTRITAPKFEMFEKEINTNSNSQTNVKEIIIIKNYPNLQYNDGSVNARLIWKNYTEVK